MSRGRRVLPHWLWCRFQWKSYPEHMPVPGRDYTIDLEEGSQHLIRYKVVAPLVASGAVQLI